MNAPISLNIVSEFDQRVISNKTYREMGRNGSPVEVSNAGMRLDILACMSWSYSWTDCGPIAFLMIFLCSVWLGPGCEKIGDQSRYIL
jgi:hypothetical protein